MLDAKLNDVNKDKKVLIYCTGGIRCVKVGAYLQQQLGFTNVHRLKGNDEKKRREERRGEERRGEKRKGNERREEEVR